MSKEIQSQQPEQELPANPDIADQIKEEAEEIRIALLKNIK